jgi:hypothetical protein
MNSALVLSPWTEAVERNAGDLCLGKKAKKCRKYLGHSVDVASSLLVEGELSSFERDSSLRPIPIRIAADQKGSSGSRADHEDVSADQLTQDVDAEDLYGIMLWG